MGVAMIDHLDHLVLTTNHEEACVRFYVGLLGMRLETFTQGRKAFVFGNQKINLHIQGKEFGPKACTPTPGALGLCFITTRALEEVIETFQTHGVRIIEGSVVRIGATGPVRSVYVGGPGLNLIEIAVYPADSRTQLYSGKVTRTWRVVKATRISK